MSKEIKLIKTDNTDTLVLSGSSRPSRLLKNVKREWRIRYSYSYKPVKKARDRKRETIVYTMQGTCDDTTRSKLEEFGKANIDFYFYNPLVTPDTTLCTNYGTRCAGNGDYGYDKVVIVSCETEIVGARLPQFMFQYRLNLEEAVKP